MERVSTKGLVTWWITLGAIGLLVFVAIGYPRPTSATMASSTSAQTSAAPGAAQSGGGVPAASAATARAAVAPAMPAAAPYSAPAQAPRSAVAPPYNPAAEVDLTFKMDDRNVIEVASSTFYQAWTFNGTVPGPVVRVRQGAKVNVTLINEGTLPHSLDFHSARTPISNYRNVPPGETFSWSFEPKVPGVYLYHCGTAPALQHIGNGMYGVMIVDPDPPLAPADREYVLLQSEFYFGDRLPNGVLTGDFAKMQKIDPDIVGFNGHQSQYRDQPLVAEPGELVRLYVVDAGPTHSSSFHVVGEIFDKVYTNGNPRPENLDMGVQTATVPVGGGAMFDLRPEQEGDYLFVSHAFAHATKGAVGVLRVGQPPEEHGVNIDH